MFIGVEMNSCTNKKYNFPHKNWLLLLNVHEKQRKKASRPTYSDLYAYAANNPVRYLDPDGRFYFDDFFESLKKLISHNSDFQKKFAEFYYIPYASETYVPENGDFFTKINNEVYIVRKTEYGKLSTLEKIQILSYEWDLLAKEYEENKSNGIDTFENLFYGTGEVLFSSNSYSTAQEFLLNLFGNNLENLGDLAQFDLDSLCLIIQLNDIEKEINKLYEEYLNE